MYIEVCMQFGSQTVLSQLPQPPLSLIYVSLLPLDMSLNLFGLHAS